MDHHVLQEFLRENGIEISEGLAESAVKALNAEKPMAWRPLGSAAMVYTNGTRHNGFRYFGSTFGEIQFFREAWNAYLTRGNAFNKGLGTYDTEEEAKAAVEAEWQKREEGKRALPASRNA